MQRGGRIEDTSDYSAGRRGGRTASRAAERDAAIADQLDDLDDED